MRFERLRFGGRDQAKALAAAGMGTDPFSGEVEVDPRVEQSLKEIMKFIKKL